MENTLEEVNEYWNAASVLAEQQLTQFAINEALINNRHITKRKIGRSSIFVPKIAGYLRRKLADFVGQFTGDEPISFKNTLNSSSIGAKIYQKVHNHYINRMDTPYTAIIYNGAYCGLAYNFAPAFIDIERQEVEIEETVQEAVGDELITKKETRVELADISVKVENLPPEYVRVDPSVTWENIDNARYIGIIRMLSRKEVEEKMASGEWKKITLDDYIQPVNYSTTAGNQLANERRSASSPFASSTFDIDEGLVEIRHHYHYAKNGKDWQQVLTVTLADQEVLLDSSPLEIDWGDGLNQAWPFVLGLVYPKPNELYAAALPEQAKDLQIEVNAIRNQRRDNVALILNPEKYVTPQAGVEPEQLAMSFPGKVVPVNNLASVHWQTVPDVTASGHNEETRVEQDMDRLFSEGPLRSGVEGRRKESATAIQMMTSNASAATGLDTDLFRITFVEPLNRKIAAGIKQLAPDEVFYAAAAELLVDTDRYDPVYEATKGQFKINVFASATQTEFAAQLSNISNTLGVLQTLYGPNANYKPLIDPLIELLGHDPDSIVPNPLDHGVPDMSQLDMGGVEPQGTPSIMPRAQFLGGGGMPEGSGNQ